MIADPIFVVLVERNLMPVNTWKQQLMEELTKFLLAYIIAWRDSSQPLPPPPILHGFI